MENNEKNKDLDQLQNSIENVEKYTKKLLVNTVKFHRFVETFLIVSFVVFVAFAVAVIVLLIP